jgi:hypothetical protein
MEDPMVQPRTKVGGDFGSGEIPQKLPTGLQNL